MNRDMNRDIQEILFTPEAIAAKVAELGKQITADYQDKSLLVIGILKGSNLFTSDLVRAIDLPLQMDFMAVSSYGNATQSSGVVRILKDLEFEIAGKDILIVEDMIDSGLTLKYLTELLATREPNSIQICTLLNKSARREADIKVDYVGFEVPDGFIVGYGIDYAEQYRNLPYVGILKPELYENK